MGCRFRLKRASSFPNDEHCPIKSSIASLRVITGKYNPFVNPDAASRISGTACSSNPPPKMFFRYKPKIITGFYVFSVYCLNWTQNEV
jgi:hypothetical protein